MKSYQFVRSIIASVIILIAFTAFIAVLHATDEKRTYRPPEVEWLGYIVTTGQMTDKYYLPSIGYLPAFQLGLREDGMVVWRRISTNTGVTNESK